MNSKDLIYIGLIVGVSYFFLNSTKKAQKKLTKTAEGGYINGGLDQPLGMDLPNLTPNQGMSTEDSLNQGNILPLGASNDNNEPEQLFGFPLPAGITPISGAVSNISSGGLVFNSNVPVVVPVNSNTSALQGTLTTDGVKPAIKKEDFSVQNISPCGNSFSVRLNDKDNSVINYWYDGTYYYQQTMSNLMRSVPVRITFRQYSDACTSSMNSVTSNTAPIANVAVTDVPVVRKA